MSQAIIIIKAATGATQASRLWHFFKGKCPSNRDVYEVETDTTLFFTNDARDYLISRQRLYIFMSGQKWDTDTSRLALNNHYKVRTSPYPKQQPI